MIKVGVIGAGSIIGHHLKALGNCTESKIVAVADINIERAEKVTQTRGGTAYTDYMEMLDKEELDAVIINLPHSLHEPAAVACAERGIHTLLEKPMSVSEASCQRINDAFKKSGALLQVGHVQRYRDENLAARKIIESGELGELVFISTIRTGDYFTEKRPGWFWHRETAGGGMSLNLGAHGMDKACYLSGSTIKSCTGKCTYYNENTDVDSSAQTLLTMENGVTVHMAVCGYHSPSGERVDIYLTKGMIRIESWEGVKVYKDGKFEDVDLSEYPDAFILQWNDFIQGIKEGRVIGPTGEYSQQIVKNIQSLWNY